MTEEHLIPCKFCGSSAEHDQDAQNHPHEPEPHYRVRCSSGDCDWATPFGYDFETVDEAVYAWNTIQNSIVDFTINTV